MHVWRHKYKTNKPESVFHCHCESCRRSTGQPLVTFASFNADSVCFSGIERSIYASSKGVSRTFCSQCGTPLAWEGYSNINKTHISNCTLVFLLSAMNLYPDHHVFYEERVQWFDVADQLPRYSGITRSAIPMAHGPVNEGLPSAIDT